MVTRTGPDDSTPAELLALVEQQRARTSASLDVDVRLLLVAWGLAWLVGLGAMALANPFRTGGPLVDLPGWLAGLVLLLALVAAAVLTTVHSSRRGAGMRGRSSRQGAFYGWAWALGFTLLPVVVLTAQRHGAPPEVVALLWPVLSGFVVGLLYVMGAAVWDDPVQLALGVWVLAVTAAAALAGPAGVYAVMALGGGGGFLVGAAVVALRRARS